VRPRCRRLSVAQMARERPEKKREEQKPTAEQRVLPMQLKVGDRIWT
jgi:hypothetical protein